MENETVKNEVEPVVDQVVEETTTVVAPQVESSSTEQGEQTETATHENAEQAENSNAENGSQDHSQVQEKPVENQQRDPRPEQARRWAAEKRELVETISDLKKKVDSIVPKENLIAKKLAAKLNIQESEAQPLAEAIREAVEESIAPLKPKSNVSDEQLNSATEKFKNSVGSLRLRVDEKEWASHEMGMFQAFQDEVNELISDGYDGKSAELKALEMSPKYYLAQAKVRGVKSASQALVQGKTEMANKINQKNAASVESAKSSSAKPVPKQGLTREQISKMSTEEFSRRRDEIDRLAKAGAIK